MQEIRQAKFETTSAQLFACLFVACAAVLAGVIGAFPLQLSIVTIFLFAGVHNWFEFRYFAARMPLRWGKSKVYYTVGIGGVIVLTFVYLMIYAGSGNWLWSAASWRFAVFVWNTALVLWLGVLFYLRGRQKPQTDWSLAFPAAFLVAAFVWLAPHLFSLALVYLHPFVALWFLERQIRRTRRTWLKAYRFCLLTIPVFVAALYFLFAAAPDLSQETNLFWRIAEHAGSGILTSLSSHFLVATHVFLETIHYAVWIVLIPLADRRAIPWRLHEIPLAAKDKGYPKAVAGVLIISLLLVLALWLGFALDYETTRDVYFAFAIAHVLAEFPFLVKML
ncbi:MAG TPA: hypothetical protein VIL74_07935 [Pyrinomonadaceae bacterium]|jgi:hypothetical protein